VPSHSRSLVAAAPRWATRGRPRQVDLGPRPSGLSGALIHCRSRQPFARCRQEPSGGVASQRGARMSSPFGTGGSGCGSTGVPKTSHGARRNRVSDTSTGHGKVVVNRCMSLDGFIAAAGHVMDWGAGRQLADFVGPDEFQEIAAATGAMLAGRRTSDVGDRMEAEKPGSVDYPFFGPVFVLTHRPPEPPHPGITYLTGDIGEAVARAARAWRSSAPTSPPSACRGASWTRFWCTYCRYCSETASASRRRAFPGSTWCQSAPLGRATSPSSGSASASNRCVACPGLRIPSLPLSGESFGGETLILLSELGQQSAAARRSEPRLGAVLPLRRSFKMS
jgi:hypothetical protein